MYYKALVVDSGNGFNVPQGSTVLPSSSTAAAPTSINRNLVIIGSSDSPINLNDIEAAVPIVSSL
jgi:hypothetical protein